MNKVAPQTLLLMPIPFVSELFRLSSPLRGECLLLWHGSTISENPVSLARTTEIHLRTTTFRLLHFIFLIRAPLASRSLPFLSFLNERLAQRNYNDRGIKQKDAAIFPPSSSSPPLLRPFIFPSIFPSSAIYGKFCSRFLKGFHQISFLSSIPSSSQTVFLKGEQYAMDVVTRKWKILFLPRSFLL